MHFSFVIPTHRRPDSLFRLLDSIAKQQNLDPETEVIIVQNPADERVDKLLAEKIYPFHLSNLKSSIVGVNHARNLGMRAARGDYCIFLDDDCLLPTATWFEVLKTVGTPKNEIAFGGRYLRWQSNLVGTAYWALLDSWMEMYRKRNNRTTRLIGGCLILRRNDLIDAGGFDATIAYGSAETELILRLLAHTPDFLFCEKLSVHHDFRISAAALFRKAILQGTRHARFLAESTMRPNSKKFDARAEAAARIGKAYPNQLFRRLTCMAFYRVYIFVFALSADVLLIARYRKLPARLKTWRKFLNFSPPRT